MSLFLKITNMIVIGTANIIEAVILSGVVCNKNFSAPVPMSDLARDISYTALANVGWVGRYSIVACQSFHKAMNWIRKTVPMVFIAIGK